MPNQRPEIVSSKGAKPLWIWNQPVSWRTYVIGHDAASGGGGEHSDSSATLVLDADTLETVAGYISRAIQPEQQAEKVRLLSLYYRGTEREALVNVENLGHGEAVLSELRKLGHTSFYREKRPNSKRRTEFRKVVGFTPTNQMRTASFDNARRVFRESYAKDFLSERGPIIRWMAQLEEMASMEYDDSNRAQHPKGGHDDITSAWRLALWAVRQARARRGNYVHEDEVPRSVERERGTVWRERQIDQAMKAAGLSDWKRVRDQIAAFDRVIEGS